MDAWWFINIPLKSIHIEDHLLLSELSHESELGLMVGPTIDLLKSCE